MNPMITPYDAPIDLDTEQAAFTKYLHLGINVQVFRKYIFFEGLKKLLPNEVGSLVFCRREPLDFRLKKNSMLKSFLYTGSCFRINAESANSS